MMKITTAAPNPAAILVPTLHLMWFSPLMGLSAFHFLAHDDPGVGQDAIHVQHDQSRRGDASEVVSANAGKDWQRRLELAGVNGPHADADVGQQAELHLRPSHKDDAV